MVMLDLLLFIVVAFMSLSYEVFSACDTDAILTMGRGYDRRHVDTFLQSWWKHTNNSTLFFHVEKRPNVQEYWTKEYPVMMESGRFVIVDIDYGRWKTQNLNYNRFIVFQDLVKTHQEQFCRVLIVDVRDVLFQRNPFENIYYRPFLQHDGIDSSPVIFSSEERHFGNNPLHNDRWVKRVFGDEVFSNVFLGKQIFNAGLMLGPTQSMIKYLELMLTIVKPDETEKLFEGVDQAIHNYIYYYLLEKGLVKLFNYVAPTNGDLFFTVAPLHNGKDLICTNASGVHSFIVYRCQTDFMDIPAMVHQYDRSASILEAFVKSYQL